MFKILAISLLGLSLIGCGNSDPNAPSKPKKPKTEMQEIGYSEISATAIKPNPTQWFDLVPGSSKHDLYKVVCKK